MGQSSGSYLGSGRYRSRLLIIGQQRQRPQGHACPYFPKEDSYARNRIHR